MIYETINQESILKLMDIFYDKVRKNEKLGPIFNNAIGVDNQSWQEHKKKIGNFWMGMLLGEGDYKGQPLKAHIELPPFPREFFEVWLELFSESLKNVYTDETANIILQRANMISSHFQNMLYHS
ncbi:group III truncated hemoglobin [Campylobacter sp. TTU-622]|uniref:group III truncated hemoglobin n=1 Tax=unclassified Campylobacter TaxID=2593542 RepID=UPI001907C116|nr:MULTISPECIES: group III truncated hemoglobin [unclassified Campylobacter]MBK1971452.1 group III truncated hemoglobin [Campylobacter sp. TTU_617]MBK1972616.1 group III truncated hemoglobin [Campylobacter sp. TTU-622]MBK1991233.1 group III truncated hemoglobin [Campylobacter sp. 2018MI34]